MDLEKLIFNPVESLKDWRTPLRKKSCVAEASKMIKVSSAYCMTGKSELGDGIGSLRKPCWAALLRMDCSRSAARTKSKGERGSPCLTPLLQWKVFPGILFNNTAEVPDLRIDSIHDLHFNPKPLWAKTSKITLCSILSNAFSKSNFRTTISFLEWWHKWRYSKDQARQSWIVLVLMKPYWFWCTSWRITLCSLFANSFVINLIEQFSKEIGLKSPTCYAPSILGIRVINESFMLWRQTKFSWKSVQRA